MRLPAQAMAGGTAAAKRVRTASESVSARDERQTTASARRPYETLSRNACANDFFGSTRWGGCGLTCPTYP